jgi:hypothetical protein
MPYAGVELVISGTDIMFHTFMKVVTEIDRTVLPVQDTKHKFLY